MLVLFLVFGVSFITPIGILVDSSQQLTFVWMASASAVPSSFQAQCFAVQLIFTDLQGGSEEFAGIMDEGDVK